MKRFYYKAIKDQKELVSGYIEAENNKDASDKVRKMGFLPTYVYDETIHKRQVSNAQKNLAGLSLSDLISFTDDLYTYTMSEIPILSALDNIKSHAVNKKIADFATHLSVGIKSGKTLSEAMEDYRYIVGETYIALCKTGEDSGTLAATFGYLKNLLQRIDNLRHKFIRISIYPTILVFASVLMFFLMGSFVFPRLIAFIGMEAEIPRIALFFVTTCKFIISYWWLILLIVAYLVCGWIFFFDRQKIKAVIESVMLKTPVVKDCMSYISLAHYMSVLHIAYEAGVPITDSLRLAAGAILNKELNSKANLVTTLVEKGTALSSAFYDSGLIPDIFMPMIATGEETGKLGKMFRDIAIAISNKLDAAIEVAARAFEPIMTFVIGIFVAIAAITVVQLYASSISVFAF